MVDLSKCMSQPDMETEASPVTISETTVESEKVSEKVDPKPVENVPEVAEEEKMEVDSMPERRFSQNSDNNNELQEITPVQTDNDEVF